MVGGHLDSWIAGSGATDNGAGTIVAMEAIRILNALHVKPRRTIRIALWSGEEEGVFGSTGYVARHFATFHYSGATQDQDVPRFFQKMSAPPTPKLEAEKLDAYYNMDNGTGKLMGIYTEGNEGVAAIFSQWMEPLTDLGMTAITRTHYRRNGSCPLSAGRDFQDSNSSRIRATTTVAPIIRISIPMNTSASLT